MKNEKISLDKLKEMKEVLENKNTLLMNPIMPTILGYSIKEIIDEFIKEKTKYDMPIELKNMSAPPTLKPDFISKIRKYKKKMEEYIYEIDTFYRIKIQEREAKRKAEMIEEVIEYQYPKTKLYYWNERSDQRKFLKELSPEIFKIYMMNFYEKRINDKTAERRKLLYVFRKRNK